MLLRIGHRGAMGHEPENTLRSFDKAVALGCDMIELDVHRCKSGELVVIHDSTMDRTTDLKGRVRDMTLADIQRADAGKGESVPTLSEVMARMAGKCNVNIELKSADSAEPVAALTASLVTEGTWSYDNIIVSSFNHRWLASCRGINPALRIGLLFEGEMIGLVDYAKQLGAYSLHPGVEFLEETLIQNARRHNLKTFVWTVNSPADIAAVKAMQPDGIISNFPERI